MKLTRDEFVRKLVMAADTPVATPVIFYSNAMNKKNFGGLIIVLANENRRESIRNLDYVDTEKWDIIFVGKDQFPYSDLFEIDEDGEIYWCSNIVDRNWKRQYLKEVR